MGTHAHQTRPRGGCRGECRLAWAALAEHLAEVAEQAAHSLLEICIGANGWVDHGQVIHEARKLLLLGSYRIPGNLLVLLRRRREEENELHDLREVGLAKSHVLGDLEEDVQVPLALHRDLLLLLFGAEELVRTGGGLALVARTV